MSTDAGTTPLDLDAIRAEWANADESEQRGWALDYGDTLLAEVERLRAGIVHIVDRYGSAPGIETCATMYDLRRLAQAWRV